MDLRDKFRKAAGLFVEIPAGAGQSDNAADFASLDALEQPQTAPKTIEQIVSQSAGPSLAEVHAAASAIPVDTVPDANVEFSLIYQQAGVPSATFTAEQTLDMLSSMPVELPMETKRQTVNVTLGAMGKSIGATPETIVTDASRKLAALAAYADSVVKRTEDFSTCCEKEIAELQAQIDEKRQAIQSAKVSQTQVVQRCHKETDRLDDVLEFFSLDVAPSKLTPPAKP